MQSSAMIYNISVRLINNSEGLFIKCDSPLVGNEILIKKKREKDGNVIYDDILMPSESWS